MAFPFAELLTEIQHLAIHKKRPEREIRNFVRELSKRTITGSLKIASVAKTIAYTKRHTLRDGNTIKSVIPETDYIIELQLDADERVEQGGEVTCMFCLYKFDGYSKTLYGHQIESEASTQPDPVNSKNKAFEAANIPGSTSLSTESSDPLDRYQAEAFAKLSQDGPDVSFDTSYEEEMLAKLQLEAEQRFAELNNEVGEATFESQADANNEISPASTAKTKTIDSVFSEAKPNTLLEPKLPEERSTPAPRGPNPDNISRADPPQEDTTPETDGTNHSPHISKPSTVPLPGQSPTQKGQPQEETASNATDSDTDKVPILDDLIEEALGDSEPPITLKLLSAIVSGQTGIPVDTVNTIQKAMWTHLSSPATFGEGKATYKFPLLGKFTVRKDSENVSLDFASSKIEQIADATINESVTFEQAKQLVETDTGPQIARHVLPLALTTAASMGLQQAQSYLTIYRTILLILRILAKGKRRIRIDDVGEFFPSIVAGSEAYRFRAYPTLLRATSSAFKDATVFMSRRGEAQERFDSPSETTTPQNSEMDLKGCLFLLALIIGFIIAVLR